MRTGVISLYAGATAPAGYLVCDGSAVSRTAYSELFSVIGTSYGPGDGSTTFNLPNLAGRVVIGVSSGHALATSGGEETHVVIADELPAHTHTVPQHGHGNNITATTPKLTHTVTQPNRSYTPPSGRTNAGRGSNYNLYTSTTSSTASRTAKLTVANHAAGDCTMSGGVTDCPAFDSENAGGGVGHNNMQPFITMLYVIGTGDN